MATWRFKCVIVLVGLPARGKSYIAHKVVAYLRWKGLKADLFNVGKYRRNIAAQKPPADLGKTQDASFFDPNNRNASEVRERLADAVLNELLEYLRDGGDVGIFDATNSTRARRKKVLQTCRTFSNTLPVVFCESICDDAKVLEQNYAAKIRCSPDYRGMDLDEAMTDLKQRVAHYERAYQTVDDINLSYVKVINFRSQLIVNKIFGRLPLMIVMFLMSVHMVRRPIWLIRAGACDGVPFPDRTPYLDLLKSYEKAFPDPTPTPTPTPTPIFNLPLPRPRSTTRERALSLDDLQPPLLRATSLNAADAMLLSLPQVTKQHAPSTSTSLTTTSGNFADACSDPGSAIFGAVSNSLATHPAPPSPSTNNSNTLEARGFDSKERVERDSKERERSRTTRVASASTGLNPGLLTVTKAHLQSFVGRQTLSMTYPLNARGLRFANAATRLVKQRLEQVLGAEGDAMQSELFPEAEKAQAEVALKAEVAQPEAQNLLPLTVLSSTHQRAIQTAQTLGESAILFETHACLNAQNMGVMFGLDFDEVCRRYGPELHDWASNRFTYRFPAAQSHQDLAQAMEPLVLDMERQVLPVAVVTHSSTLQVLYGYFLGTSKEQDDYTRIEVPEETVIELVPSQYGWTEKRFCLAHLCEEGSAAEAGFDFSSTLISVGSPVKHKTSFYEEKE
jgi:broad specificity phosphatase PhoE/predicted kinase